MKGQVGIELMLIFIVILSFGSILINPIIDVKNKQFKFANKVECKNKVEREILMLDSAAILCDNCELKIDVDFENGSVICGEIERKPISKIKNLWGRLNAE